MTSLSILAPCVTCKRYRRDADLQRDFLAPGSCDAYPDGIPVELWWGTADHRQPFDGDQGLRFAPNPRPANSDERYGRLLEAQQDMAEQMVAAYWGEIERRERDATRETERERQSVRHQYPRRN